MLISLCRDLCQELGGSLIFTNGRITCRAGVRSGAAHGLGTRRVPSPEEDKESGNPLVQSTPMEGDFDSVVGRLDVSQDFIELAKKVFDSCQTCIRDTCTGGNSSQVGMPSACRPNCPPQRQTGHVDCYVRAPALVHGLPMRTPSPFK